MLPSVADIDVERLSEEARETLLKIARPMSEEGAQPDAIAFNLGITRRDVSRRLEALGFEMKALAGILELPPLSAEEFEALKDSIAEHGQLVPILVDAHGKVVDGHNRERAMAELGLVPEVKIVAGDADELQSLALVANVARRHLTAGARRGLVARELRRDAARSDRSIAIVVGVSHHTVAAVRVELEEKKVVGKLPTRIGRDGVAQPAGKPFVATLPDATGGGGQLVAVHPVTCPNCGHTW